MLTKDDPQVFFRTLKMADKPTLEKIHASGDGDAPQGWIIEAETWGLFAIHKNVSDDDFWTVTHVPSGQAVQAWFESKRRAKEALAAFLLVIDANDWRFTKVADMPASCNKSGLMMRNLAKGFYDSAKHTFDELRAPVPSVA